MSAIMRKYLAPAGYEFQKVLTDFESLSNGKEPFERGALTSIEACGDNNQLYEALERFANHVLPYYDDYEAVSAEIIATFASAVKRARETPVIPIDTPFGSLPGHTIDEIAALAAGTIDYLRYIDVEATFDTISDLYEGAASDEERKLWLRSAQTLSKHELSVWEHVGPRVQTLLVDHIRAMSVERQATIRPLVLTVLREVLSSDVSRTSSTYNAITLHQGTVNASEELQQMRAMAIDVLTTWYGASEGDAARREIVHALRIASSMPGLGKPSPGLVATVLNDACRIIELYTHTVGELSFELRQEIEHDLLWMYLHNGGATPEVIPDEAINEARQALLKAILEFRGKLNNNEDFVVYKTLVGFKSVFPPAWHDPEFESEEQDAYRTGKMEALVADVSERNAGKWLAIIRRCAATDSGDLATFPPFQNFLEKLGRTQPAVMIKYLGQIDDQLARFLPAMLLGLVGTPEWPCAEAIVQTWVSERRYLGEVAWSLQEVSALDTSLLPDILVAAIETEDDGAVLSIVATTSARHSDPQQDIVKVTMLSAIAHLSAKRDTRWVNAFWPRPAKNALLLGLSEAEVRALLDQLIPHPRVEHRVDNFVAVLASKWPQPVIEFFWRRLQFRRAEKPNGYEAVPFELHSLNNALAQNAGLLLAVGRGWFDEDRDSFHHYGARLVAIVFPAFSGGLEALLLERVKTRDRDEIAFVLSILRAYTGQTFLQGLCKEIVAVLPSDDQLAKSIEIVLDSMGITTGEFGRVAGFKRKRTNIEPWLQDPRDQVRSFAKSYLRGLDNQIAAEQRRSEEDMELRKLEYESPDDDAE